MLDSSSLQNIISETNIGRRQADSKPHVESEELSVANASSNLWAVLAIDKPCYKLPLLTPPEPMNKIPHVHLVGGRRPRYIEHEADYVKLNALHRHGGVTLDFDVIIVNGTQEQRLSECVLAEEDDHVNAGFSSCIKNSSLLENGWKI